MKVNKFSLLFIAGAVVVAAGLVAVQKKVDPSGEATHASASAGHQGHAMPSSASANDSPSTTAYRAVNDHDGTASLAGNFTGLDSDLMIAVGEGLFHDIKHSFLSLSSH